MAERLLGEYRTLSRLWSQTPQALAKVLGGWPAVVELLESGRDAQQEMLKGDLAFRRINPLDQCLRRYLTASMGSLPEERLRVLFLDAARMLLADEQLQQGTLAHMSIYPRTILRRALELNAASIILIHNHPSGDARPSDADIEATATIERLALSLDIELLDHIIVTAAATHHMRSGKTKGAAEPRLRALALRSGCVASQHGLDSQFLQNARATIRKRMLRRQLLGANELFGEPAWDMLLELFVHECEGRQLSMSSLCTTAAIPESSAMRLAQRMCDAGLLERRPDPADGRRSFMKIAPETAHRLRAYFAESVE
ncbi:DNA repair protein RadC [Sphingopyxis terrae subsp. ummariensis]|uniref:DNA repair protein RadC n=1 Tax=Sphingopyxis terrae subsp. ummariensis TaxID=429001 RepID=A0A1Y6FNR9_9SPHN|nr:DNA repair protein RadC [Sphingopyxis terrae subsp. ummariensis]